MTTNHYDAAEIPDRCYRCGVGIQIIGSADVADGDWEGHRICDECADEEDYSFCERCGCWYQISGPIPEVCHDCYESMDYYELEDWDE